MSGNTGLHSTAGMLDDESVKSQNIVPVALLSAAAPRGAVVMALANPRRSMRPPGALKIGTAPAPRPRRDSQEMPPDSPED
eukprot:9196418-Pyramimonas_sp.AAC.1